MRWRKAIAVLAGGSIIRHPWPYLTVRGHGTSMWAVEHVAPVRLNTVLGDERSLAMTMPQ
jgi:hypothetical protein